MSNIYRKTLFGAKEIFRGMYTVLKHAFRPAVTLQYPEQRPELKTNFKGRLALLKDENGKDLCISCRACQKVCPCVDLIHIESHKDENNKPVLDEFTIDLGRCIYCGNCTEVCPTGAIVTTKTFEFCEHSREALVYDKRMLTLSPEESAPYRRKK